jgi:division protein CdvB (Snf7/Vps24/ESCRT-III family)
MSEPVIVTNRLSANDILVRGAAIERRVRNVGLITSLQLDKADSRLDQIVQRLDAIEMKLDVLLFEQQQAVIPAQKGCCECCAVQ